MVREEYLNSEFMYKFINSLCKRDGWILEDFTFGKLEFKRFNQPILMRNNHGYNMVYKCDLYKIDENVNYGHEEGNSNVYITFDDLRNQFIRKTVYFDILNECFVNTDDDVQSFEEFPAFFMLDGQIYYAIYNQPCVLRYHYSKARCTNNIESYMRVMGITSLNLFDVFSHIYNVTDSKNLCGENFAGDLYFAFKTHNEANNVVSLALNKVYDCENFVQIDYKYGNRTRCRFPKLRIHEHQFPVFYTANVLEITVPIAKAVNQLANDVSIALNSIQNTLFLMTNSLQRLMYDRLSDVYSNCFNASWDRLYPLYEFKDIYNGALTNECIDRALKVVLPEADDYTRQLQGIKNGTSKLSDDILEIKKIGKKLSENIKQVKASNFSLNALLEISDDFKILESKLEEK